MLITSTYSFYKIYIFEHFLLIINSLFEYYLFMAANLSTNDQNIKILIK